VSPHQLPLTHHGRDPYDFSGSWFRLPLARTGQRPNRDVRLPASEQTARSLSFALGTRVDSVPNARSIRPCVLQRYGFLLGCLWPAQANLARKVPATWVILRARLQPAGPHRGRPQRVARRPLRAAARQEVGLRIPPANLPLAVRQRRGEPRQRGACPRRVEPWQRAARPYRVETRCWAEPRLRAARR